MMRRQPLQEAVWPRHTGFTLVEILIVVLILGILAAIVLPQFSSTSGEARAAVVLNQMQTVRRQLTLYRLQHNDQWPDLIVNQWSKMLERTDANGSNAAPLKPYGPYLQSPPKNPLNQFTQVAAAPGAGVGYVFDAAAGTLWATGSNPGRYYNERNGAEQDAPPDAAQIRLGVSME